MLIEAAQFEIEQNMKEMFSCFYNVYKLQIKGEHFIPDDYLQTRIPALIRTHKLHTNVLSWNAPSIA